MSIKKQLSAYYDKQGLTGKHRRKAMQWDRKALRTVRPFSTEDSLMSYPWKRIPPHKPHYWVRRYLGTGA